MTGFETHVMDRMMGWFAPRSALGFVVRLLFLISIVLASNIMFAITVDEYHAHPLTYYFAHAVIVGGPLIAFFLAVCTFQVRLQRKLWRLSRKDPLTGLNNRRTFLDSCETTHAKNSTGVLMMLDADFFKKVNDTYGHQVGDKCLQTIAYVLKRNIRQGDILGRIGGEEFAIYLKKISIQQAKVIGERLTKPIAFQSEDNGHLTITLSIGAVFSYPDATMDQLFAQADKALYRAKIGGRARMIIWDHSFETGGSTASA